MVSYKSQHHSQIIELFCENGHSVKNSKWIVEKFQRTNLMENQGSRTI